MQVVTYNININQIKAIEWKLSIKAALTMSKLSDLSSWAEAVFLDGKTYHILYRSKLLEELPILGKSLPTVSKALTELEEKEIIESIHKNTAPAYRLTDKGREWVSDTSKPKNGEKSKKFSFRLKRDLEYDDLDAQYKENLKNGAMKYIEESNAKRSTFDDFINHRKSKGIAYKNWASAFKMWVANSKKYEKLSDRANPSDMNNTGNMEL